MHSFINKRVVVFGLMLALACSLSIAVRRAQAQDKLPKPDGAINDFAEVIDSATKKRLETVIANLKQRTNLELVVAVMKSAGSEDLYDYSLRTAKDWGVGPASTRQSLLLLIAVDKANFFTQFSRGLQAKLPDGVIGEMGARMRPRFASGDFNGGLLEGLRVFVNAMGERGDFTFATLDESAGENLVAQRPRTVSSPAPSPADSPTPQSIETATPQTIETPTATPTPLEVARPLPSEMPIATPTPMAAATETPQSDIPPSPTPSPTVQPSETPLIVSQPSPQPSEVPSPAETPVSMPSETPPQPSPSVAKEIAENTSIPTRSPGPVRKPSPSTSATPGNPDDEKEEVELTLTKQLPERIAALKAFIAAHPNSPATPRANELLVMAHALLADQKMQANDIDGGLQEFTLAFSEAPADMPDRLFIEVIARIPMNLFVRGQRTAATDAAHLAEALAKLNPKRLLVLVEFDLAIEDAAEANRLAELAVQTAPDLAAAHQALGAARHIALRLDEAESEYARSLALDPKLAAARIALADLKRAAGKNEDALALYREQLQLDPKSKPAHAGLILSLLELGKKAEADKELADVLANSEQERNLPLLVGASYWFMAHDNAARALELSEKAMAIEPRYSWAQIARARALMANGNPLEAERALRFARQFGRFPTLDYELAGVLASMGLYDEAVAELARSFTLKDGQIETRLAGRNAARADSFIELLAPERRAAIFQAKPADTDAGAKMMKALLTFANAINKADDQKPNEDEVLQAAKDFIGADDAMRTFRRVYVAGKLVKKGVALSSVVELMDQAMSGVEAALSVPAATVAVQAEELSDIRASALAQGGTPNMPEAPRSALSGLLRGHIEDLAGLALFNTDKFDDAIVRFRRATTAPPEGTPLWRSTMWHLGSALAATGRNDEALLYYIKSYVRGNPDPARRAVIENIYKKVNGTLDGLNDKIGPGFGASPSATPE
jgi:tetratricopeptide (TPR) repeat protein